MTPIKEFYKRQAEQYLVMAREINHVRQELVIGAERLFGIAGPLVSGCHRDHYPEPVKYVLRELASQSAGYIDASRQYWNKAGCRFSTWMTKKQNLYYN